MRLCDTIQWDEQFIEHGFRNKIVINLSLHHHEFDVLDLLHGKMDADFIGEIEVTSHYYL